MKDKSSCAASKNSAAGLAPVEIMAPAGSRESLEAAVRCGANAVYLGGKSFNARRSAANFDDGGLTGAVEYCHARNVKVYLTLNTLLTDRELLKFSDALKKACEAGVDAIITQDLAAAAIAKRCAPGVPLFASTQMSVHNQEGAKELESLGFSRVVLAREMSEAEIRKVADNSSLELECFIHGALCMSVSGQCYFSAMLGGRSGNRGLCAQPCRLPMRLGGNEHALSLKDMSLIGKISAMVRAGVSSVKIEGRMKRPEYVAAAVTACRLALTGKDFDTKELEAVFSRNGFTGAYFDGKPGPDMFGARTKDDVAAASPALLNRIAASYRDERPLVPVRFLLRVKRGMPAELEAYDYDGNTAAVSGEIPEDAKTFPITEDKARVLLSKTGGTPFYLDSAVFEIDGGLSLPVSAVNALRRCALEKLLGMRGTINPHSFDNYNDLLIFTPHDAESAPALRVRVESAAQLTPQLADEAGLIIVPAQEIKSINEEFILNYKSKIAIELPRIMFGGYKSFGDIIKISKQKGITQAVAGNLGAVNAARTHGLIIHGDYSLNVTNSLAIAQYEALGLASLTASIELTAKQIASLKCNAARGIIAYGHLPLMVMRACPSGECRTCKRPEITDRLGNRFPLICRNRVTELQNCVPLFLADKLNDFKGIDFITLYFTGEPAETCLEVLDIYRKRGTTQKPKTRGLYYRGVS